MTRRHEGSFSVFSPGVEIGAVFPQLFQHVHAQPALAAK